MLFRSIGCEYDKTLEDIEMEGRRCGLVRDPNLTPKDQMMLLNKTVNNKRVVQEVNTERLHINKAQELTTFLEG